MAELNSSTIKFILCLEREKGCTDPLAEFGIELVECNMSSREEDVFDTGIDPLKHREVEELGALLVQLWH